MYSFFVASQLGGLTFLSTTIHIYEQKQREVTADEIGSLNTDYMSNSQMLASRARLVRHLIVP